MRVKLHANIQGPGPSERIVAIQTTRGHAEEVVVHASLVEADSLSVSKLGQTDDSVIIELPTESVEGNWRLAVPPNTVE